MRASIFTPSHDTRFLDDCYRSVVAQTVDDWEWIVLLNGGAQWVPPHDDPRIRVIPGLATGGVGAVKREACALATGEILIELDHDDVLDPRCVQHVLGAFDRNPGAVLVYSDFAQIDVDGHPEFSTFDQAMGWEYAPAHVNGLLVNRCRALAPSPHNVGYIWYAPNHVRAFRRSTYDRVGGYDPDLQVLDDQDLMMRLYEAGEFHHLDACLYLQRMHPSNTQRDTQTNALIQTRTVEMYHRGIAGLAVAWAHRAGLAAIDLSTRAWPDRTRTPGTDDLEIDEARALLPYGDGEVGVVVATDLLQRVQDRAALFAECYRVLAHGGMVLTLTPSTDGRGAFQDPTHVSYWNQNSFWYLTQTKLRDRAFPGHSHMRFQISGLRTSFLTETDRRNDISYVTANLLAVKDGQRQGGPLLV